MASSTGTGMDSAAAYMGDLGYHPAINRHVVGFHHTSTYSDKRVDVCSVQSTSLHLAGAFMGALHRSFSLYLEL